MTNILRHEGKKGKYLNQIGIPISFLALFLYASLLLITGYTQRGLSIAVFGGVGYNHNITWLLLAQSLGIILSNILVGRMIARINIRYLISGAFVLAATMLLLISQLPYLSDHKLNKIIYFCLFSFILGMSIGPIDTIIATLFGTLYTGKKRMKMLSSLEGMYGIGTGIIPLLFARIVIGTKSNTSFTHVQHFYYIAVGMAILGAICGIFINYHHSRQHTSGKILDQHGNAPKVSILKPLLFALSLMFFIMTVEGVVNWSFVRISTNVFVRGGQPGGAISIRTIEAFGLLLVMQGISRPITGIFILPYINRKWYIFFCALILIAGFGWILGGAFSSTWAIYIIAVMLGLGIGNLWPVIFSYTVEIDNRRSSFIGVNVHITSTSAGPIIQLLVATLWVNVGSSDYTSALFMSPIIIGIIVSVIFIVIFVITSPMHNKIVKKTSALSQKKLRI